MLVRVGKAKFEENGTQGHCFVRSGEGDSLLRLT